MSSSMIPRAQRLSRARVPAAPALDVAPRPHPRRSAPPKIDLSLGLLVAMHASVLFVFLVPFSWPLLLLALGGYVLRMFAITAGYHRYFSHRSFATSRAFQFLLALLGTASMQNGPLWWASWHRKHHKHSDTELDPHSPQHMSFWHSHLGWVLAKESESPDFDNIKDLVKYPELRFLEKHKWLPIVLYGAGCFLIAGWGGLVWGFVVSTILLFHATCFINSLAHVWGTQPYETGDSSRNNALLAIITLGEGWHNNHHRYMSSARQGFHWWQIDFTFYVLKVLGWLGVVWNIRERPRTA